MTQPRPRPARLVTPAQVWSGGGVLAAAGEGVLEVASRIGCVAGNRAWEAIGPALIRDWGAFGIEVIRLEPGSGTLAHVERLAGEAREARVGAVLGCGGGVVLDTAKLVAHRAGLPGIALPGVVSCGAAWTPAADLLDEAGAWSRRVVLPAPPEVVILDLALLRATTPRMLAAALAGAPVELEIPLDPSMPLARTAAATVAALRGTLRRVGLEAVRAARQGHHPEAWGQAVEAVIHFSGLAAMVLGPERPASIAQAVARALSAVPGVASSLYGERLAFGAVVQALLAADDELPALELVGHHAQLGLPLALRALGSSDDPRRISALARRIADLTSWELDPLRLAEAVQHADALGKVASACRPITFPGTP
ncbi:MAG: iron-containing alcohol dehydrogenase [bacterium]|nr:iron-containing alcohol dehydrogenase [bacterium]